MPNILALDLGTTALKLLLLSESGAVIYNDAVPYPTKFMNNGWIEQDPHEWEKALMSGIRAMLKMIPCEEINAISFSGHMSSIVVVDLKGNPVYPCITLADSRSELQTQFIRERFNDVILRTTNNPVLNAFTLPKLLWIKQEKPDAYKKAAFWMSAKDYLRFLLIGQIAQDTTDSFNSLCLDIHSLDWNTELIREIGLNINIFPEILLPYQKAGQVSQHASDLTGLKQGTPVYAGGADMACAGVSMGMNNPGDASISLGTNAPFMMIVEKTYPEYSGAITYHVGAQKGTVYALGSHFSGGAAVNNFAKTFSADGSIDYKLIQELSEKAFSISPGSDGVSTLPFFVGSGSPYFRPDDRGTVVGLSASTSKAHLFRSLLEGITLNMRQTYDMFRSLSGGNSLNISLFGGGTKIPVWPQLFADIFGIQVRVVSNPDASAIGAALLGGFGAGIFHDLTSATQAMLSNGTVIPNSAEYSLIYEQQYEKYKRLYDTMRPFYEYCSNSGGDVK